MIYHKKETKKEPWQISASRYFVENSDVGFTYDGYMNFVLSKYKVNSGHISQFWQETILNPSGRQHQRNADHISKTWIPPLELVSTITDYDELVEARKNAKQAFWLSIIAIIISAVTLLIGFFQIRLAKIQVNPILYQQAKNERDAFSFCNKKENENMSWPDTVGGQVPCNKVLEMLKGKFGQKE